MGEPSRFWPRRGLGGGHRQTLAGALLPAPAPTAACSHFIPVAAGTELLLELEAAAEARSCLLLVHGLGGSAASPYMLHQAAQARAAGHAVARLNLRNAGGTAARSQTLYHAGLHEDLCAVLGWLAARGFAPLHLVGFSMGGNLVLRAAARCPQELRPSLGRVVAVNPALDLDAAVHNIDSRPALWLYRRMFCRELAALVRLRAGLQPERYPLVRLAGVRGIRDFDARFTAPEFGFDSAEDYYRQASALPLLADLRVPALVLQSADDPLIPRQQDAQLRGVAGLELRLTAGGGHLGYQDRRRLAGGSRFWAGQQVLDFLAGA